jgi:multidrug efflux system membrane fusion protein
VAGQLVRVAFREGDLVKKGALLFVVDPRPYEAALARAEGALQRSEASLALAQRDTERAKGLITTNTIAEREWDSQNSSLDQFTADARTARADVSTAKLNLEFAYVRAPVDGRIGRANITVGNLVGPDTPTPLATLTSVDPLYVYFDVEEARALKLRPPHAGHGAEPTGAPLAGSVGFAGEDGYPHEGKLDFIDNRVDPATGTIKLRLVVPNGDGRLTPGLFARVELPEGEPHPMLLLSDRAVGTDQDRKFVYVIDRDNKVEYLGVQLGPSRDGLRVVREGVSGGDRIIVRGLQRVRPGAVVVPEVVPMRSVDQPAKAPGGPP